MRVKSKVKEIKPENEKVRKGVGKGIYEGSNGAFSAESCFLTSGIPACLQTCQHREGLQ